MKKIASELLIERLIEWGVDTVFGLPGDGINGLMEALRRHQDAVRFVLVHHEEAAAFMATGYAKSTGRLGVCLATSGPGGIHLLNAILEYFMELFRQSEGTFKVELHDVLADDERGVALQHATAQRSGKTWDSNDVIVFHVSDGKTTAAWFHPGDQYAFDAFWSD